MAADKTTPTLLIAPLLQPTAYPHPVRDLRVVETHISWLILTGDFVYKIKKPVSLGFVDFSTLERRQFFCQEELRLNRRLAPELYLDVVAITGPPTAPRVSGDGEAIEFAVKLRQFDAREELSANLQRQPLSRAEIAGLAQQIAEFHQRVPLAPADSPFGRSAAVRGAVDETLDHLAPQPADAATVEQLRRWTETEGARCETHFEERRQRGFVRECHGDLHLGNMLRRDGRIVIFDCLEFNPNLRFIDVISDLAFTAMDLEYRGFRPDAWRLLNAYLSATGDYSSLTVLRWYLVYRALVRAKVAQIAATQQAVGDEARSSALERSRGYLALAERLTQPRRPLLIITHGLSGSGKTTLTEPIMAELGAVRVRSDVERKRLANLAPLERSAAASAELYSSEMNDRTYGRLAQLAELALRAGWPVIVDATFLARSRRDSFRQLAKQTGAPLVILQIQSSDPEHRERLRRRSREGSDASDADLAVYQQQLRAHEPLGADELCDSFALSSDDPKAVTAAIRHLERLAADG